MNREQISRNFHLARVLAILAVIVGHYAQVTGNPASSFLWIGAQMGLCIFAFSSGYFTSIRYQGPFSISRFWKSKIPRLLAPLLVIDAFLLVLFLYRGEANVFHWQSVLAGFGVSGVLRWFEIPRVTPFGNGLWFFTLLLIFYATYPLLERINRSRIRGMFAVVFGLVIAMVLQKTASFGVTFWETAWFFVLGSFCGRHWESVSWRTALPIAAACGVMLPITHLGLEISWLTPVWVTGMGLGAVLLVTGVRLPMASSRSVTALSVVMLEMYVVHTYLFVTKTTGSWMLDLSLSVILIAGVSFLLHPLGSWLGGVMSGGLSASRQAHS